MGTVRDRSTNESASRGGTIGEKAVRSDDIELSGRIYLVTSSDEDRATANSYPDAQYEAPSIVPIGNRPLNTIIANIISVTFFLPRSRWPCLMGLFIRAICGPGSCILLVPTGSARRHFSIALAVVLAPSLQDTAKLNYPKAYPSERDS